MKCIHCGNEAEVKKTIRSNGSTGIAAHCPNCNRRATAEPWLPNTRFTADEIAAMPVEADYRGAAVCQYRGCNATAVEWNHYAPRALFGEDCENWPIGPLCVAHHRTWHVGLEKKLMRHCPKCRQAMNAAAIVDAFPEPANWEFYGKEGYRFIRCRGMVDGRGYVHFVVKDGQREYHRLAYGIPQAQKEIAP